MGTPFRTFTNLFITYAVGTGEFTQDKNGIARPVTTTKTVSASVEQETDDPTGGYDIGPDTDRVYLLGNLVSPKLMPADMPVSQSVPAVLKDPATETEYHGEFELEAFVPQRFKAVSRSLGTPIKGFFTFVGGG